MKLVIVESPAKCKKIEDILGKPYLCRACMGHICEMKDGLSSIDPVTKRPSYHLIHGKGKTIKGLREYAKKADEILIATDPDREGEGIAYYLTLFVKLPMKRTHRIIFHEITHKAVWYAVQHPQTINMNIVYAQQARQVLDLFFGFTLSPVLWKEIGPKLSAGRCQSPALRMVCERQELVESSHLTTHFTCHADFSYGLDRCFILNSPCVSKTDVLSMIRCMEASNVYRIHTITCTPKRLKPKAPFITSTIQQECFQEYGIPVASCMQILQSLYEKGKITYMRTDNPSLSDHAKVMCRSVIESRWGTDYHDASHVFVSTNRISQDAHEAIRPTDMQLDQLSDSDIFSRLETKVYRLIWKRTIASQMSAYEYDEQIVTIHCETTCYQFQHISMKTTHLGWKVVYDVTPQRSLLLPDPVPEYVMFKRATSKEEVDKVIPRMADGTLVKEMERQGIGRPSTYASICQSIVKRGYVEVKDIRDAPYLLWRMEFNHEYRQVMDSQESYQPPLQKSRLVATPMGKRVYQFLMHYFPRIMNYQFTSTMENHLEAIAKDKSIYQEIVETYMGFLSDEKKRKECV